VGGPAGLGPPGRQRARLPAQGRAGRRPQGPGRDPRRPDRSHAQRAIEDFARDYGTKWAKAVAKITDDAEELLCFFDYPAEHWGT
jgi:hypothetical protein